MSARTKPVEELVRRFSAGTYYHLGAAADIELCSLDARHDCATVGLVDRWTFEFVAINNHNRHSMRLMWANGFTDASGDSRRGQPHVCPQQGEPEWSSLRFKDHSTADNTPAAAGIVCTRLGDPISTAICGAGLTNVGLGAVVIHEMLERGRPLIIMPTFGAALCGTTGTSGVYLATISWLEVSVVEFYAHRRSFSYWREFCAKAGI